MLQRSEYGDYPGFWAFPGGKVEKGEDNFEGACRECFEEIGRGPETAELFTHRIKNGVDFTTYIANVDEPFTPRLNDEHDEYRWVPVDGPWPEPIHPGALLTLKRFRMNETEVAEAIRDGELTSPQFFHNIAFFAMRVTGTGRSFRSGLGGDDKGEHVYRDPDVYLNEGFLKRVAGTPLVLEHPPGNKLNSEEFQDRIIGTCVVPWIKGSEVWCIGRTYDEAAVDMLRKNELSTSPAVIFSTPKTTNVKEKLPDGSHLLFEGAPELLDHLAVCRIGVWDKGGPPTGVINKPEESKMAGDNPDVTERNQTESAMADKAKKDAEGGGDVSERILAMLEKMNERISKLEGGSGGEEGMADKAKKDAWPAKKDAEGEGEEEGGKTQEDLKEEKADKAKKDADPGKEEEEMVRKRAEEAKADKAKKDAMKESEEARMDALIERRIAERERAKADSVDEASFTEARNEVREVAVAFGDQDPGPRYTDESLLAYKKRLWKKYAPHSKRFAKANFGLISDMDTFDAIKDGIKADSLVAAFSPATVGKGKLREIRTPDGTGRIISTFVGDSSVWLDEHKGPKQYLARINTNHRG